MKKQSRPNEALRTSPGVPEKDSDESIENETQNVDRG